MLFQKKMALEALSTSPSGENADLHIYTNKTEGELPEVTGKRNTTVFGQRGDQIAKDLGWEDHEDMRRNQELITKVRSEKKDLERRIANLKIEKRDAIRKEKAEMKSSGIHKNMRGLRPDEKSLKPTEGQADLKIPTTPEERIARPTQSATEAIPSEKAKALKSTQLAQQQSQFLEGYQPRTSPIIESSRTPYSKRIHIVDRYGSSPRKVLTKIGLGSEFIELRSAKNNARLKTESRQEQIRMWAKANPGTKANVRIAKFLDGQTHIKSLKPHEQILVKEIRTILDNYARKLGLVPGSGYLNDYFPHIFDKKSMRAELPEDIALRIMQQEDPASSTYNPFLTKRHGVEGYKLDTWSALDAFFRKAERSLNMDPILQKINAKTEQGMEATQYAYIKDFIDRVNFRPTRTDTETDNLIKQIFGDTLGPRPTRLVTGKINRSASRGAFWFNPKTAIRNITQGVNTYAELGERWTVQGYVTMAKKLATQDFAELHREGILESGIAEDHKVKPAFESGMEKADKAGFSMMRFTEFINRAPAYYGAKAKKIYELKSQGIAGLEAERSAIEYAKDVVEDTQFRYDELGNPIGLSSDIAKTITKFQTYTIKQLEFLGRKLKTRDIKGLTRYAMGSMGVLVSVGSAIGLKLTDFLPGARILEEGKYVPPLLQPLLSAAAAALNVPGKYGETRKEENPIMRIALDKDVQKSLLLFFPRSVEGRRLIQSTKTYKRGGKISKSGKSMTFPVDTDDPLNVFKLFLLGEYETKEGQEYIKGGAKGYFKKLDKKPEKPKKPSKPKKPTR